MYLADIYTISANLAGLPGISVPCGLWHGPDTEPAGLPIGLQLYTVGDEARKDIDATRSQLKRQRFSECQIERFAQHHGHY